MTSTTYCDACGEPINRKGAEPERLVHVSVSDLGLLLRTDERSLSRSLDFHRDCYTSAVEPTWRELEAR